MLNFNNGWKTEALSKKLNLLAARLIIHIIPSTCPFERNLSFLGYKLHIPPICKINPFYNVLVNWRLKAMTYLID